MKERIKNYYRKNYVFPSKQVLIAVIFGTLGIGGITGFIYETIFYMINDGHFVKRGTGFGPWINIYGLGGILLFLTIYGLKKSKLKVFILSGLISGVLEYIVGYLMYTCCDGLRTWNYNTEIWSWGNIGGFVCNRSVLVFAIMGVFMVYVLVPCIVKLSQKFGERRVMIIMLILGGAFLLDLIYNDLLADLLGLPSSRTVYGVTYDNFY